MSFKEKLHSFLVPRKIAEYKQEIREQGMKNFLKKVGWKVILIVVIFYLIRDSILYLLIPYLIAKGVISSI